MDQLVQEIANLKEQETAFLAQCAMAETEEEERAFTNELNIVRNKLLEKELALQELKKKEQQRADVIEERVNAEPVPFSALGINLNGAPVEVIELAEGIYRTTRRICLKEHAIELEQLEESHESFKEIAVTVEAELRNEANTQRTERFRLESDIFELRNELKDMESKRDAAVREKEELERVFREELAHRQAEITRLQSEIEDYQRAKVFGERQAQQIIDITPEETTTLQQKADAVKKLFTKVEDWGSSIQVFKPEGGYDLVKRAEFEAEWTPATPVVPELPSFRNEGETTAAESQDIGVQAPEVAEALEGDSFQSETSTDGKLGSNEAADGHDVGVGTESEATLEERVAQVEKKVDILLKAAFGEPGDERNANKVPINGEAA